MDFTHYRFLVMDDHSMVTQMVTAALRKTGAMHIDVAENGEEGLQIIDAGGMPDIIISDLNMPNLDGIEIINGLAERGFSGGLIIISGSDACMLRIGADLAKHRRMNMLGTLSKPFRSQDLIQLIRNFNQDKMLVEAM